MSVFLFVVCKYVCRGVIVVLVLDVCLIVACLYVVSFLCLGSCAVVMLCCVCVGSCVLCCF